MVGQSGIVEQFEQHRGHLRAVAFRMLGSRSEAEDALQEGWLRPSARVEVQRGVVRLPGGQYAASLEEHEHTVEVLLAFLQHHLIDGPAMRGNPA